MEDDSSTPNDSNRYEWTRARYAHLVPKEDDAKDAMAMAAMIANEAAAPAVAYVKPKGTLYTKAHETHRLAELASRRAAEAVYATVAPILWRNILITTVAIVVWNATMTYGKHNVVHFVLYYFLGACMTSITNSSIPREATLEGLLNVVSYYGMTLLQLGSAIELCFRGAKFLAQLDLN